MFNVKAIIVFKMTSHCTNNRCYDTT